MGIKVWVDIEEPKALCFTANTAWSTVKLYTSWSPTSIGIEASTDYWSTWNTYTLNTAITLANAWDRVYMRNKSTTDTRFTVDTSNYYKFSMTWSISASWDVTCLLNKNWTNTLSPYCFYNLFYDCSSLTTAPSLPATTLSSFCYQAMFGLCKWLTTAPELPGTISYNYSSCYKDMFIDCTSLTTAPNLPSKWTSGSCYHRMFQWCTSLTTAPSLPATALNNYCYAEMFRWCTSLTTLPSLPATYLQYNSASYCYQYMFYWCSKIKLSTTKTWTYQTEYRIPTTWTLSMSASYLNYMFTNTWWTFTWTPTINTTYYTSNTVV